MSSPLSPAAAALAGASVALLATGMVAARLYAIVRAARRRHLRAMAPTAGAVVVRLANHSPHKLSFALVDPPRVAVLAPNAERRFESYPGTRVAIRLGETAREVTLRIADNARQVASVLADGQVVGPWEDTAESQEQLGARYAQRVESERAPGLFVVAMAGVAPVALERARAVVDAMLATCAPPLLATLGCGHARVALIGATQVTTDIPEHAHLRGERTADGRDFDAGTRGLGGTRAIPTTSVGEENVLHLPADRYAAESILVHEFAHHVMNLALDPVTARRVTVAYEHAMRAGLYARASYIAANDEEYWAESVQAWFDASVRTDVNGGVNTREKLLAHDPAMAALLSDVFGSNPWRYTDTMSADERARWGLENTTRG